MSIVREMRQTVFRTAHSPVISEAQDFSCALFNARGEMVAQSRDMPGHVIAMPASVAEAMKDFGHDLHPGDVISTGTPPGVGMGKKPPQYLRAGDVVELGIAGLGQQRQDVIDDL